MLDTLVQNLTAQTFLNKAVAAVAGELNIARRNWSAYPPGHPIVEASLQRLQQAFRTLLDQQTPVQIGVTRDGLLLGEELIEKGNQICRAVATALFERGIGTAIVRYEPPFSQLQSLLRLLTMKREDILSEGGVESLWSAAEITAVEIRGIRYDRFSGTEESALDGGNDTNPQQTGSLWERFVRLMMQGEVGLGGSDAAGDVRPEVLAAALNARFAQRLGTGSGLSASGIRKAGELMQQMVADQIVPIASGQDHATSGGHDKDASKPTSAVSAGLQAFIAALDPTLRRHILDGFCETASDADDNVTEELFRYLGPTMLQDTYATAEEYSAAPPLLQGILRRLLPHLSDTYDTATPQDEVREKVRTLIQEHRHETYVPDDYLLALQDLLAETPLPAIDRNALQPLINTLHPTSIESRSSEIIMQLVVTDPDGENIPELIQNLADMCGYFLELGDYGQVLKILSQAADPKLSPQLRVALRDAFSRREFLDEILSGLKIWGKPKYDQVAILIQVIGRPFIPPLLDRLADEENMSLRRFMMDRVLAFGEAARPALVERLADQRWYVLRNIVVMLRTLAPGQEVDRLRPLLKQGNQKLRQEVIKSLLLAGDPIAQRQVLRDLDSSDRETQLAAINLADKHSSPEMARKLAFLIQSGGFTPIECELKTACIQALSDIGRPEILPELDKVLATRSLLAYKALQRIKLEIVKSIERYPLDAALPMLERLAAGSDELAQQARESFKNVRSRPA